MHKKLKISISKKKSLSFKMSVLIQIIIVGHLCTVIYF